MTNLNTEAMDKARQAIIGGFKKEPFQTFVDLKKLASPYIETKGDKSYCHAKAPTLVAWAELSEEFIDLIDDMIAKHELFPNFVSPFWYGGERGIDLPYAALAGKRAFEEPHWIPVVFGRNKETPEEAIEIMRKSWIMKKAVDAGAVAIVVKE